MTDVNSDDLKMEITLDVDMSSLDLDEKGLTETQTECDSPLEVSHSEKSKKVRRSKRKRFHPVDCDNRRATMKPKKIIDGNYKETINYYLDKRVKKLPSTLETIFEEPKSGILMSSRRFKRCLTFPESPVYKDKVKIKKRILKSKKVHPMKKLKKLSMELLLKKLTSIDSIDQ